MKFLNVLRFLLILDLLAFSAFGQKNEQNSTENQTSATVKVESKDISTLQKNNIKMKNIGILLYPPHQVHISRIRN